MWFIFFCFMEDLSNREWYDKSLNNIRSYVDFSRSELTRALNIKSRNSFLKMIFSLCKKNNEIWFPEFKKIDKELQDWFKTIEYDNDFFRLLESLEKDLESALKVEELPQNKIAITYILSKIRDKKFLLNWNDISKEFLLKANLKIWDILLLNKKAKRQDIWSKLLKVYDDKYLTDFSHCAIFLWFDEDRGIVIRHSTTETKHHDMKGVEDTLLDDYMFNPSRNWAFGYDVLVLRPNHDIKNDILHFSESQIWKWYDNKSALRQWLWLKKKYNDKYNCVELVVEWLNPDDDPWVLTDLIKKTFPNDLLEYLNIFKPVYITTIDKS